MPQDSNNSTNIDDFNQKIQELDQTLRNHQIIDPNSQALMISVKIDVSNFNGLSESYQYHQLMDVDRSPITIADGRIRISNATPKQATFEILDDSSTVTVPTGQSTTIKVNPEPYTTTYNIQFLSATYAEALEL